MAKKKAASKKDSKEAGAEVDFEQALEAIEQIVCKLEGGQLGLSESLQQYELGIRQLKRCQELLDAAEQRVSVLAGFDAEGNPVVEPLEGSATRHPGSLPGAPGATGEADDLA
jgi:exodeoxyribonuclease VII small subunit